MPPSRYVSCDVKFDAILCSKSELFVSEVLLNCYVSKLDIYEVNVLGD